MTNKIINLIDELKNLTLLETSELVKEIEKVFNVDVSLQTITQAPPTVTNTQAIIPAEEKTSFDILLTEVPTEKKIAILKVVRTVTGLGLKESKEIVDNIPKLVKEGLTKDESETIKKELEAAGAKIIIK